MGGKKKRITITVTRRIVQICILLFILYGGLLGITKITDTHNIATAEDNQAATLNENLQKDPRLNLYLPIRSCKNTDKDTGVFQGCGMFMLSEALTFRNFFSYAIPLAVLLGLILLFGRTWCGWACPVGLFQDIFDWIRRKLKLPYYRLPRNMNELFRKFRYAWLSIILLMSFAIGLPIFSVIRKDLQNINCLTCPTRYLLQVFPGFDLTFMSFKTGPYAALSIVLIFFLVFVACGFFIRHFWCRICPNGAFLSLFNKGCLTTKEKDLEKCTKCGICYEVCPIDNEDVYQVKDRKIVNSKNCLMCFACVEKCPEKDCLKVKIAGKTVLRSKSK